MAQLLRLFTSFTVLAACVLCLAGCNPFASKPLPAVKPSPKHFAIGWTSYVGWAPWELAERMGIVKKWADRSGITIDIVQMADYMDSVDQYNAGHLQAVTVTLGDALLHARKDSTVVLVGDYSNGNDVILSRRLSSACELGNSPVHLVQGSTAHYLLYRSIDLACARSAVPRVVDMKESEVYSAFIGSEAATVATWQPYVSQLARLPGTRAIFNSSSIPYEVLDVLLVDSETLRSSPQLGTALVGIWYEVLGVLLADSAQGRSARRALGHLIGVSPDEVQSLLATTAFFTTAQQALAHMQGPLLLQTLQRHQAFAHRIGMVDSPQLLPTGPGIVLPDQQLGSPDAVRLRVDTRWLQQHGSQAALPSPATKP